MHLFAPMAWRCAVAGVKCTSSIHLQVGTHMYAGKEQGSYWPAFATEQFNIQHTELSVLNSLLHGIQQHRHEPDFDLHCCTPFCTAWLHMPLLQSRHAANEDRAECG